jgi:hypothetical protein
MTVDRPNTLAGLLEKRAEIAGQIGHTRAMLRQLIIDLDHVDAAIRIFDPSYDVEGIRQKIPIKAHRAIRSDMTRATLDALRDAPGPMTTKELARHVMAERGLNTADAALLQLFTRRTGALLRWQKKRGILRSIKDPQHGRFDLWEIAILVPQREEARSDAIASINVLRSTKPSGCLPTSPKMMLNRSSPSTARIRSIVALTSALN